MACLSSVEFDDHQPRMLCWAERPPITSDRAERCKNVVPVSDSLGLCESCKRRLRSAA